MLEKKKKAICWSFLETLWLIFGYTPYPISISIEVGNKETRMWPLSTRISNAQDDPECSQPAFILTTLLWKWEPDNCVWSSDRWCERWSLRAKTTAENMRTNVWKGNHVSVIPLITFDQISDIPLGWNSLHQQVVMVHRAGNVPMWHLRAWSEVTVEPGSGSFPPSSFQWGWWQLLVPSMGSGADGSDVAELAGVPLLWAWGSPWEGWAVRWQNMPSAG